MKSVVFVGGTISNMISAIELSNHFDVYVFELNAEIGLPSISPGIISNLQQLDTYITKEQINFLQPKEIEDGFSVRSEWVLKHLAVTAAEKNVQIFTRTRISESFSTKNGFSIEYTGAGPNNMGQMECNYLVDDRQWTYSPPGAKHHNISVEPSFRPNFGSFHPMHGGTALTSDCTDIPPTITTYNRYEGLTEVWQKNPEWIPKHGWIESISCQLPLLEENRTIDAQIHAGRLTANHLNEVN